MATYSSRCAGHTRDGRSCVSMCRLVIVALRSGQCSDAQPAVHVSRQDGCGNARYTLRAWDILVLDVVPAAVKGPRLPQNTPVLSRRLSGLLPLEARSRCIASGVCLP